MINPGFLPSTWGEAAAAVVSLTGLAGVVFWILRNRLQVDFSGKADKTDTASLQMALSSKAEKSDIAGLAARLGAVEDRLNAVPSHDDFRHLSGRVGAVERQVDVVGADVRGIGKGVERLERMTEMLVRHHVAEGSKGGNE